MFVCFQFVCLAVFLSVCQHNYLQGKEQICMKHLLEVCLWPMNNALNSGGDSEYDPGVHITKNPNFDPILTFSYFHYKS